MNEQNPNSPTTHFEKASNAAFAAKIHFDAMGEFANREMDEHDEHAEALALDNAHKAIRHLIFGIMEMEGITPDDEQLSGISAIFGGLF